MTNKLRALVVEDDLEIMPVIEDELCSLGHTAEHVTNQASAEAKLESDKFDYVLLDLEIPARPNRGGASTDYGVNLLKRIRETHTRDRLPVIIMTAQGKACVNLTTELTQTGANEFISKPFGESGKTLAKVITSVLDGYPPHAGKPEAPVESELRPFKGGTMLFATNRIELLGELIAEKNERANYWPVLHALKSRRDDGRFIPTRGTDLAKGLKGGKATENTVSSCVNDLRGRITKAMSARGLKCGKQDVIMSGGPGYRFNPWIKVEERDGLVAGTCGDRDMSDVPAPQPNVPATSANVPLNDRQHWVLEQLRAGVELQRPDIEKRFRVTEKTAKRDLSDLVGRGLIAFERTPRPGHYRLAKRSPSGRPADKILENRDLQRGLTERIHETV